MTLARSLPEGNDVADGALARLARLRTQALTSAPAETARRPRPTSAPSPLGGARRSMTRDLPAWGDSAPAAARIEPLRLAVLGTLAAIVLIVGFGVTQRLAQSRAAPHAAAAPGVAAAAQIVATSSAPAQTAVAAPALMPPPAAVTPSAQLSAIKQALDGSGSASTISTVDGTTNAATTSAATDAAPPLSDTAAPAIAAPLAAAQPSTGWGAPPGQQAAVGNDAWTTPPAGYVDQQGTTIGPVVGAAPLPGAAIVWPVVGPMTSCFCPYHPLGIDIGVPLNTPVRAMAAGRVTFAGGDACCSYGYYVDIDHGNGIMTRYGHLSYIPAIPIGTPVRPGDIIGMSGTTGFSTGPHLHFEVRLNGVPVNPMDVLP